VPLIQGMTQSFYDAPGGLKEELKEINYSAGLEYWYDKQFALRAGYFHESPTKGNRKYLTFGTGFKFSVFGLDLSYLVAIGQNHPLNNTLRFSFLFDFDAFASQTKDEKKKNDDEIAE
jgi:long-subunit fatty acid transport protein